MLPFCLLQLFSFRFFFFSFLLFVVVAAAGVVVVVAALYRFHTIDLMMCAIVFPLFDVIIVVVAYPPNFA